MNPENKYNKENYFKVPDQYFENLFNEVVDKVENSKPIKYNILNNSGKRQLQFAISMAAVLLVLFIFYILMPGSKNEILTEVYNMEMKEAITVYLQEYPDESEIEDLFCELSEKDIKLFNNNQVDVLYFSDDSVPPLKNESFELDTGITREDMINYLMNEEFVPEL